MRLVKGYDQNQFFTQIMAISFLFSPNFSVSLRDPQICSDLHEIVVGVHYNIVEWDKTVAVNPKEHFWYLIHPTTACVCRSKCRLSTTIDFVISWVDLLSVLSSAVFLCFSTLWCPRAWIQKDLNKAEYNTSWGKAMPTYYYFISTFTPTLMPYFTLF